MFKRDRAQKRISTRVVAAVLAGALVASAAGFAEPAASAETDVGDDLIRDAGIAPLPADVVERVAAARARFDIDTPWSNAVQAAINPDDYECDQDTEFGRWIDNLFGQIDPSSLDLIFGIGADFWPAVYSIAFDQDPTDDYIGAAGEYTRELTKRHRHVQRSFWDLPASDVRLHGMHGAYIADDAKMVPVVQSFGFDEAEAQFYVDLVQELIATDPALDFDHPLFTLNAFAIPSGNPEVSPGKIVMGDGILDAYAAIGLRTNAPDLIHAHEFAHHVQFAIGAFESDLPGPEATRRTELMADAFAAYNLAHARGASFQTMRIVDIVRAGYIIGDCAFDNPGHHGTPNQREAAVTWGAELAQSARPQGKIRSAETMLGLFEAQLPALVAPDAHLRRPRRK